MKQSKRVAKMLFRSCLINGMLDQLRARQLALGILHSRRGGYVEVLREFKRLVKLQRASETARIETATSLPSDLLARIREGIERVYGREITTALTQNPNLIGGLRIQVGSDVYDGSVLGRLAALKTRLGVTQ